MSRYVGPRLRIMRALGSELPGLSRKKPERRPYRPGQHGQARRKVSEYGLRLAEKQKLRYNYGVTERQLRNLMHEASGSRVDPGSKLLELLERRLDNIVFRAGFARTIPGARQLVAHGHVRVDGRRVDIPSYRLSARQVVTLAGPTQRQVHVLAAVADTSFEIPGWLQVDKASFSATMTALPDASAVPFPIDVRRVVEFYAVSM